VLQGDASSGPAGDVARDALAMKRVVALCAFGFLFGLAGFFCWREGFFVRWRRLPDPPARPVAILLYPIPSISIQTDDSSTYTLTSERWVLSTSVARSFDPSQSPACVTGWPPLSPFTNPPRVVTLCSERNVGPGEWSERQLVALAEDGTLWEWSRSNYVYTEAELCVTLPLGGLALALLLSGAVWLFRAIRQSLAA
jgi:hypothetical protein